MYNNRGFDVNSPSLSYTDKRKNMFTREELSEQAKALIAADRRVKYKVKQRRDVKAFLIKLAFFGAMAVAVIGGYMLVGAQKSLEDTENYIEKCSQSWYDNSYRPYGDSKIIQTDKSKDESKEDYNKGGKTNGTN